MFDVGFSELVLIFVLGLLILGPERLPRVAAQLGRWVGKARHMASQLRRQLERELDMNEIMHPRPTPPPRPEPPAPPHAETPSSAEQGAAQPGDESEPEPAAEPEAKGRDEPPSQDSGSGSLPPV
jgi:sec-independent protein translocase protein TatB